MHGARSAQGIAAEVGPESRSPVPSDSECLIDVRNTLTLTLRLMFREFEKASVLPILHDRHCGVNKANWVCAC